jgi:hypothetical protein
MLVAAFRVLVSLCVLKRKLKMCDPLSHYGVVSNEYVTADESYEIVDSRPLSASTLVGKMVTASSKIPAGCNRPNSCEAKLTFY